MNTKLTLCLDKDLIDRAKVYAAKEGRSVSELVAAYFARLDTVSLENSPDNKGNASLQRRSSFHGLIAGFEETLSTTRVSTDKALYREHLRRKHL